MKPEDPTRDYEYVWDDCCTLDPALTFSGSVRGPLGQCRIRVKPKYKELAYCLNGCGRKFYIRVKHTNEGKTYFVWVDIDSYAPDHRFLLAQETSTPLTVFDQIGDFSDIESFKSSASKTSFGPEFLPEPEPAPSTDAFDVFSRWVNTFSHTSGEVK